MSLQDIVTVNISLETSGVSQAGFGTPIFIGEHNYFPQRVRSYASITDVAVDFPTDSNEYIAAQGFFSQDVSPNLIKIGRQDVDLITVTPEAATAVGQVYTISVTGTDSVTTDASFTTTTGSETPTAIATALETALGSVTGVTITDATGSITLAKSGTDNFSISGVERSAVSYTTTESAADVLNAVSLEDDDFYFVTAHDHSETFVLAMAAAVEATTKIYFTSVAEAGALTALAVPATDTLGKLAENNYFRTAGVFHHNANAQYPECAAISIAAVSTPGTKVWGVNKIAGVAASQNPTTNNLLTSTEAGYLNDRNANLIVTVGGIDIFRTGKVAGNEWIDAIRNRDYLEARITEGLQNKLIASPVIPYTDSGINEIRSVVSTVLGRSVSTETTPSILQENDPFTISLPRAIDVSLGDKQARTLNGTFKAFLAGAIQITNIQGSLTYENIG